MSRKNYPDLHQRLRGTNALITTDIEVIQQNIREAADALEWKPIHDAPLDGTYVELRGDSGMGGYPYRVMIARYEKGRERFPLRNPELGYDESAWRTVQGDHCTDDGAMPTHWRPVS